MHDSFYISSELKKWQDACPTLNKYDRSTPNEYLKWVINKVVIYKYHFLNY
jgi:hypothetical protein